MSALKTFGFSIVAGVTGVLLAVTAQAADMPSKKDLLALSKKDFGKFDPQSADKSAAARMPKQDLSKAGDLPLGAAYKAMAKIGPDKGLSRDLHDTQLYRAASPAVVLIITDDGLGSGSLISKDGLVLTNLHVVQGYKEAAVIFKPAREGAAVKETDAVRAEVVRINADKDLALLKLAHVPEGLQPIQFGNMDDVQVGGDVHAIGHPTGETWTYTKGIVSQIREDYPWSSSDRIEHKATVIQTQTPISPGNSGGPLLDDTGKLIGVNTFKNTDSENLNFAVALPEVEAFLKQTGDVNPTKRSLSVPFKETAKCPDPQVIYQGPNYDRTAELSILDTTCKGVANAQYVLPRDEKEALTLTLFEKGDYLQSTAMYFDFRRQGGWDLSFWRDAPGREWEFACLHDKGSINPTRCKSYEAFMAEVE